MTVELHPVMQYGLRQAEAIKCLRQSGHLEASLALIYASIDTMAWLAIEGERAGNKGFKDWVNKYMIEPNSDLLPGVTATDLWGARCGILHTGAPESDDYFAGKAKRIFYSSNMKLPQLYDERTVILSIEWLGQAFGAGLVWFVDALAGDIAQDRIVRQKFSRILRNQPGSDVLSLS